MQCQHSQIINGIFQLSGILLTECYQHIITHGFHIHAGGSCTGTKEEPFKNAGGHYNPTNMEHPNHAGNLPPLLSNDGTAFSMFYTNRFYPEDVIGKTVIIHALSDDFKTQPSGDAGEMIACGEIMEQEQ